MWIDVYVFQLELCVVMYSVIIHHKTLFIGSDALDHIISAREQQD